MPVLIQVIGDSFVKNAIISEKVFVEIVCKLQQQSKISKFVLEEYKSYWEVIKYGMVR